MTRTTNATITRLSSPRALRDQLADDVRAGLTGPVKELPPKYLYDARGSALFEQITMLDEYYLTRTETAILEGQADALVASVEPVELVELGSGSSRKTRALLEAMHRHAEDGGTVRYVPIDVSVDALEAAADTLCEDYPWLEVEGLVGDFHADLDRIPRAGRRLIAFLGSTIGNFGPEPRRVLFDDVRRLLVDGDRFLLGVDLVKDVPTLLAAYDDARGITAEFTRNMLRVINRELDGDLPLDAFRYEVAWDPGDECLELGLRTTRPVRARLEAVELEVALEAGEWIRTEVSCKFTRHRLGRELDASGLRITQWRTDDRGWYAVALIAPA